MTTPGRILPYRPTKVRTLCNAILLLFSLLSWQAASGQKTPTVVGLNVGTKSMIGLDVSKPLSNKFYLRLGLNYMDFSVRNFETNLNRFEYYASVDMDVRHSNLELLGELSVWKDWFRLVGGAALFLSNDFNGKVGLADNFPLNDIELTPEEIGFMTGTLSFRSRVSPYVGIALGNPIPLGKLSLGLDLGVYYKGRPTLDLDATSLLRTNVLNAEVLERNIDVYRWWPVLNLRIAYGIVSHEFIKLK